MNRFYNIYKNTGRRTLSAVAMLVIGLLFAVPAMASYDFFLNNMHDIKVYHSGESTKDGYLSPDGNGFDRMDEAYYDAGWVTNLYIKNFWVRTSKGDNGNVCGARIIYLISDVTGEHDYYTTNGQTYGGDSNKTHWFVASDQDLVNVITLAGSKPGTFYFRYYYEMNCGEGNCESRYKSNADGGATNTIKFTIPVFANQSATSLDFGTVKQEETVDLHVSYTHFGDKLTSSSCAFSGTNASLFSVKSIDENGVTITFAPTVAAGTGTKSASVRISANSEYIDISLSGKAKSKSEPEVLIGDDPIVEPGPTVTLSGYLSSAGCNGSQTSLFNPYGFYYLKKTNSNSCSDVTTSGSKVEITDINKTTGGSWSAILSKNLDTESEYWYIPYVVDKLSEEEYMAADCGNFTTQGRCEYPTGDVITYTIDASAQDNPCKLIFSTFEAAIADLKTHSSSGSEDYWWDAANSMLKKEIVFQVAKNDNGYGVKNGRVSLKEINKFNATTGDVPTKRLTIKPIEDKSYPLIWGMDLASSRFITIEGMYIKRDAPSSSDGIGHACILIGQNSASNDLAVGYQENSELEFIDCRIEGDNFCCIHANGVNGFYMENCNLKAECSDASTDTKDWGASIKFMNSKNIKLLQNNFKGAHSNNIFAQNTQDMLVMNNVFWNDNDVVKTDNSNYPAIIRLVNYLADNNHDIQNIGMYYNTMYLANGNNTANADFLIFGGAAQGQTASHYSASTIEFMYNNCYSYSTSASQGKTSNPFIGLVGDNSTYVTHNNFWAGAGNSDRTDYYKFGGDVHTVNMSLTGGMVCKTVPNTPEYLVIKGTGLNIGSKISSTLGTNLGAASITNDRKYVTRPSNNTWTYGAFQQTSASAPLTEIVWQGSSNASTGSEWDNRNNWYKKDDKGNLVPVTCVDKLSDNLKVIIPSKENGPNGTVERFPVIPQWDERKYDEEGVYAGAGISEGETKYASVIELESGGAIMGIENLYESSSVQHYDYAIGNLTVPRKQWVLVGSVIKPFEEGTSGTVRETWSDDFYIEDHLPHVYMQKFEEINGVISWTYPFTDRDTYVSPQSSFALFVADQYGPYKLPAAVYYTREDPKPELVNSGSAAHTYPLTGRFAYDNAEATKITLNTGYNILNNAYPAVMNATTLNTKLNTLCGSGNYSLQLYRYKDESWESFSNLDDNEKFIYPQSGFMVRNTSGSQKVLNLTSDLYDVTKAASYKRAYADAGIVLYAYNVYSSKGSRAGIWVDSFNEAKAFNGSVTDNAEIYIADETGKYSVYSVKESAVVPLGIRNKSAVPMPVKIKMHSQNNIDSAILEDRGVEPVAKYDLLAGEEPLFNSLPSGDTEGRFFLNLNYADDPLTDVEESAQGEEPSSHINIWAINNRLVVDVAQNAVIEKILFTDLVGRVNEMPLTGSNYTEYILNIPDGTYIVTVVTDKATAQQKVQIIK